MRRKPYPFNTTKVLQFNASPSRHSCDILRMTVSSDFSSLQKSWLLSPCGYDHVFVSKKNERTSSLFYLCFFYPSSDIRKTANRWGGGRKKGKKIITNHIIGSVVSSAINKLVVSMRKWIPALCRIKTMFTPISLLFKMRRNPLQWASHSPCGFKAL